MKMNYYKIKNMIYHEEYRSTKCTENITPVKEIFLFIFQILLYMTEILYN